MKTGFCDTPSSKLSNSIVSKDISNSFPKFSSSCKTVIGVFTGDESLDLSIS